MPVEEKSDKKGDEALKPLINEPEVRSTDDQKNKTDETQPAMKEKEKTTDGKEKEGNKGKQENTKEENKKDVAKSDKGEIKTPKDSVEIKTPKDSAEIKTPKDSVEIKTPKDSAEIKTPKGSAEIKTPKESSEVKNPKDSTVNKNTNESSEIKNTKESTDIKKPKDLDEKSNKGAEDAISDIEKNGIQLDKLSTKASDTKSSSSLDVLNKEDGVSVNKSKEDSLSTATTKPAEDKSTEATPLKGSPKKFQGVNGRLVFAVAAAAFGSAFQHGYNLGVINAPLQLMGSWLNSTNYNRTDEYLTETGTTMIMAWIVSIYCIGGMIGGSLTGFFSERYGRKGGLLLNNIFAIAAAIMFGFCKMAGSWEMILIGRFLIGINNGLNAGLAPMYLSEIAPTNLRGAIGTVYQLVVTISILLSQIMGLNSLLGTEELWPVLLALTVLPAIFQLCTLPICPESAKFLLINKEQRMEAQRALTWLRDTSNVHEELEEIQNEAEAQKLVPKVSVREIVTNPALRIPLIISVMMMLAQQLSGINAAIFFSVKIYASAGLSDQASIYATVAMGTMNVLMTLVSLVLVEKAGRKTLMLTGMGGMMIDTVLLTICLACQSEDAKWLSYASIVLVILFVVMFATGPGSIPWFLVNELFASNARPTASSIAVAVNWTAAFIVGVGFLPIQQALGPYVFLVFSALLAFFIAFTVKKVPETKGRSIDEITAMFKQQAYGGGGVNMV